MDNTNQTQEAQARAKLAGLKKDVLRLKQEIRQIDKLDARVDRCIAGACNCKDVR